MNAKNKNKNTVHIIYWSQIVISVTDNVGPTKRADANRTVVIVPSDTSPGRPFLWPVGGGGLKPFEPGNIGRGRIVNA